MRNFHKYGIDTHGRTGGKIKTICPECNATRGHKGNKSFPSIWTRVYAIAITAVTNFMCPTIPKNGNDSSEKKNTIGLTNFHHIFAARFSTPPK